MKSTQFDYDRSIAHYIIPLGAAISLTFSRGGFLQFTGTYPFYEYIINIFVVVVVPPFVLFRFLKYPDSGLIGRCFALGIMLIWVMMRVLDSPEAFAPSRTSIINCLSAVISCVYIMRGELPYLRRCLLLLSFMFSVMVFIFERATIMAAMQGDFYYFRLGADVSPSVLVAFPRVTNALVIACIASALIEKKTLIRAFAIGLAIVPLLLGLATAGRGGLLGLAIAGTVFTLGLPIVLGKRNKIFLLFAVVFMALSVYVAYDVVMTRFPVLVARLSQEDMSGRMVLWNEAMENISLIGRGIGDDYAHNLFLEFLQDYGIVGLVLLLVVLVASFWQFWKAWRRGPDLELLWLGAIMAMQLFGQQFSLSIYYAHMLWAAIMVPMGLNAGKATPRVNASMRTAARLGGIGQQYGKGKQTT
jgi:hypothetical protein